MQLRHNRTGTQTTTSQTHAFCVLYVIILLVTNAIAFAAKSDLKTLLQAIDDQCASEWPIYGLTIDDTLTYHQKQLVTREVFTFYLEAGKIHLCEKLFTYNKVDQLYSTAKTIKGEESDDAEVRRGIGTARSGDLHVAVNVPYEFRMGKIDSLYVGKRGKLHEKPYMAIANPVMNPLRWNTAKYLAHYTDERSDDSGQKVTYFFEDKETSTHISLTYSQTIKMFVRSEIETRIADEDTKIIRDVFEVEPYNGRPIAKAMRFMKYVNGTLSHEGIRRISEVSIGEDIDDSLFDFDTQFANWDTLRDDNKLIVVDAAQKNSGRSYSYVLVCMLILVVAVVVFTIWRRRDKKRSGIPR